MRVVETTFVLIGQPFFALTKATHPFLTSPNRPLITNLFTSFRLGCAALLLAATIPVCAQVSPASVAPPTLPSTLLDSSTGGLSRADTARAIRQLFHSRRGGGIGWLAFGTAGILASTLPAQQSTSAGVWTPGVVAGSAFLLIGLNKRIQFRPGRERQVLRELAAPDTCLPAWRGACGASIRPITARHPITTHCWPKAFIPVPRMHPPSPRRNYRKPHVLIHCAP